MASIRKRPDGKWRARYRDPDGKEHAAHWRTKALAQRWLDEQTADLLTGRYVDPRAGRVKLGAFADAWLAAQTFDPLTRETVESRIRTHVKPHLGDVELRNLRPSTVQAWVRGRQAQMAPSCAVVLSAAARQPVHDPRGGGRGRSASGQPVRLLDGAAPRRPTAGG